MTESQWKQFEQSLSLAPEVALKMYKPSKMEMTETESISLARALLTASELMNHFMLTSKDAKLQDTLELSMSIMSGMYGRVMGLAHAYDKAVTAQTVLEAELASTGK